MTTIIVDRLDIEGTVDSIKTVLPDYGTAQAILTYPNEKRKVRLAKGANYGGVLVMRKRSRNYGYPIEQSFTWRNLISVTVKDKVEVPEAVKWEKSWRKVEKHLEESGLWAHILNKVRIALDIGYNKLVEARAAYYDRENGDDERFEAVKAIDGRLVEWSEKYQNFCVDSEYFHLLSYPAKVKKMYFGKYYKNRLEQVAEAFEKQEDFTTWGDNGYDVTFEYKPELKRAWYSEEYRGCGNGHYYLAISKTHALFVEDD